MENERAGPGRDGQTRLSRPNSQARTGTGKQIFSLFVQLTTNRIGKLLWLNYTLLKVLTIHCDTINDQERCRYVPCCHRVERQNLAPARPCVDRTLVIAWRETGHRVRCHHSLLGLLSLCASYILCRITMLHGLFFKKSKKRN